MTQFNSKLNTVIGTMIFDKKNVYSHSMAHTSAVEFVIFPRFLLFIIDFFWHAFINFSSHIVHSSDQTEDSCAIWIFRYFTHLQNGSYICKWTCTPSPIFDWVLLICALRLFRISSGNLIDQNKLIKNIQ